MSFYSFLPYIRKGIANYIPNGITTNIDNLGQAGQAPMGNDLSIEYVAEVTSTDGTTNTKTAIHTNGTLTPTGKLEKKIRLHGPEHVIGINPAMIVRTTPLSGVNTFESNYLAAIDFYDEDFPWRYTPLIPTTEGANNRNSKLRPWLFLAVLKFDEFEQVSSPVLPAINILKNIRTVLPSEKQTWAWAHAQINTQVPTNDLDNLGGNLNANTDLAISRLLSPRRLEPNTRYFAFLIPAFEAGRLAGLGIEINPSTFNNKQLASWVYPADVNADLAPDKKIFPYYHSWEFSTVGKGQDYETLVRKIKPKILTAAEAGWRFLGISNPGFPSIKSAFTGTNPIDTVKSYGALMPFASGGTPPPMDEWNIPSTFPASPNTVPEKYMKALKSLVDESIIGNTNAGPDPVLGPPLYGQFHMQVQSVPTQRNGLVETNWLGKVNLDPAFRSFAGLGAEVVRRNQEKFMDIAWQQAQGVVDANKQIKQLQSALLTVKALYNKNIASSSSSGNNNPIAFTAPLLPSITPGGGTNLKNQVIASHLPTNSLNPIFSKMARPNGPVMKRINASAASPSTNSSIMQGFNNSTVVIAATYSKPNTIAYAPASIQNNMTIAAVQNQIPPSNFTLVKPGVSYAPINNGSVSAQASSYQQATTTLYTALENIAPAAPPKAPLDWSSFVGNINQALNPDTTYLQLANKLFTYYDAATATPTPLQKLDLIMVAPVIPISMAEAMAEISPDFLMPGIGKIAQNGAYVLSVNQKIIEAYLAGANYEMNRELLWRQYPTDQRGTPLRHFWGTKNINGVGNVDSDDKNMDIKPIHLWKTGNTINNLGVNTSRTTAPSNMIVLAIRGELLRKYPNTSIYMRKATWNNVDNDGNILNTLLAAGKPRNLAPATAANVKMPLFFSHVKPDLYFVGFEVSAAQAKGSNTPNTTNPGWFIAFEERAGEIVFGADETDLSVIPNNFFTSSRDILIWDNLQWGHMYSSKTSEEPKFIDLNSIPEILASAEPISILWGVNSADLSYALYQKPNRVFIHSNDMIL